MTAPTDLRRASRARTVRFLLPDGREIVVAPPTLDQAIECLRLDPAPDQTESALEELVRLRRQFAALVGERHAALSETLDRWQIGEMVGALYIAGCGMDAELFARWQIGQRQIERKRSALEMIDHFERLSVDTAAAVLRLPEEIGAQPLADIVAFQDSLRKRRRDVQAWEASLHDKKLTD